MRKCDEHAIRSGRIAREGSSNSWCPRCYPLEDRTPNVDRKFRRRHHRSGRRGDAGLLDGGHVHPCDRYSAIPSAVLGSIQNRRSRSRIHARAHAPGHHCLRPGSRVSNRKEQCGRDYERGRSRQQQPGNQLNLTYGYDENAIYAARMGLMEGAYPNPDTRREFFRRAVRALRDNPQFNSAAMSSRFRMTFDAQGQFEVDCQKYMTDRDRPRGNFESVSDNYFTTLGLKVLEGRDFTIDDFDSKQPVALVNASFARKHYGRESAIGHRIRIFNPGNPQPWRTIVGVVPDTLMQGPFDQQTDSTGFFLPLLGADPAPQFCTILVRPRPGQRADTLGPALKNAVAELDSNLPTYFPGTPARFHQEVLSGNRIIATLFSIFGVVAFILSAVGLYGVMTFSVNQRRQEFGIRMALGADAARIFRMVMSQGAWQLAIGLVLGAGGAALLLGVLAATVLRNLLFKVNALEPSIYFAVAGLLTFVAALSCFVPARRATRVNPMVALRTE
ncbi:MAG: hypothetical protein DME42_08545 [Verrucomicrobia bacterium]|nr:MAG: hypothetical protein DME42_08545 [Verrucomicrobiota bacterium]